MKKIFPGCVAFLMLSSCASLTKSQVEAVHQFANTSKNFSAYPSEILTAMAELRVERGVYYTNSLADVYEINAADSNEESDEIDSLREVTVTAHVKELNDVYLAKKRDYKTSEKANITFKIIDKYAQSLLLLSSDKHVTDMGAQAANFGVSLDSLISKYNAMEGTTRVTPGIGGLIGSLIMAGGKQWIRAKQATEIQRFVPAADRMIGVMSRNLLDFLQSGSIESLITNEAQQIQSNYRSFLRYRRPVIQNEWDYLALLAHLDHIKALRDQTIAATKSLRSAHSELLTAIKQKKTLTEAVAGVQLLYEDVAEIKSTMHALHSDKN
ncbi:MAG: hypothetical protein ABIU63_14035 [Chitinophagaceae bacterium]